MYKVLEPNTFYVENIILAVAVSNISQLNDVIALRMARVCAASRHRSQPRRPTSPTYECVVSHVVRRFRLRRQIPILPRHLLRFLTIVFNGVHPCSCIVGGPGRAL